MKLNKRIFCVEVDNSINDKDELFNEVYDRIAEQINNNNESIPIIFFEELEPVCSECGISLTNDYEKEDLRCSNCQAEYDEAGE